MLELEARLAGALSAVEVATLSRTIGDFDDAAALQALDGACRRLELNLA